MSRHLQPVDRRARTVRLVVVGLVWIGGLVAGFFALLGVAVRYGCSASDSNLACTNSGSAVGVLIVLAVIAVVTVATVLAMNRSPRAVTLLSVGALVALLACFLAARALLGTV